MNSDIIKKHCKTLYVVVPCYNEQEILFHSAEILKNKIVNLIQKNKISKNSKIMFVDDGSFDETWNYILKLNSENSIFTGIKLSRNRGHQNALLAGLFLAIKNADVTISIDADLQDDVDAIEKMVNEFLKGFEIVYGVRNKRATDSFFKRTSAILFYEVAKFLGTQTIKNHADFRLLSKRAVKSLKKFKEVNLFLRGLVPLIGYKSTKIFYERKERIAGTSKYPLKKMIYFAIDGITSCSTKLLNFIFTLSMLNMFISCLIGFVFLFKKNFRNYETLTIFSIWFVGGLILLALSIIATYVGKIFLESKNRPRFIVEQNLDD